MASYTAQTKTTGYTSAYPSTGYKQCAQMSHTVTVTRTTTSTTTSAIILNTGYMKTLPGFLKLLQVICGAIALAIVIHYRDRYRYVPGFPELFFMCVATTFLIGSVALLLSCLISLSTASIIAKTIYEVVYHMFGFLFYLVASVVLMVEVNTSNTWYGRNNYYTPYLCASILGLILTALYLLSTIFAYKSYRGP
ncbi:hypothetical protein LSTR_LSTR011744 [Laodelphax striatellus]|uniref:MARVEL domain-containing protein n=1 Tax=Laodelphax striatellus TaxID=195883 RepID=A0A482WMQ5_LAOST|nr:hypothetical protein LSTR_LSTR011744 [Laodelphax striatellus]